MTTATAGERGQITIPNQFRTRLGLYPRMVLSFRISGRSLIAGKRMPRNPYETHNGRLAFPKGLPLCEEVAKGVETAGGEA